MCWSMSGNATAILRETRETRQDGNWSRLETTDGHARNNMYAHPKVSSCKGNDMFTLVFFLYFAAKQRSRCHISPCRLSSDHAESSARRELSSGPAKTQRFRPFSSFTNAFQTFSGGESLKERFFMTLSPVQQKQAKKPKQTHNKTKKCVCCGLAYP